VYGGSDLNLGIFSDFHYIDIPEDYVLSHWKKVNCKTNESPGKNIIILLLNE
jgi:hypothetical protein